MSAILVISSPADSHARLVARALLRTYTTMRMVTAHTSGNKSHDDIPGEYEQVPRSKFDDMSKRLGFIVTIEHHSKGSFGIPKKHIDNLFSKPNSVGILLVPPRHARTIYEYGIRFQRKTVCVFVSPHEIDEHSEDRRVVKVREVGMFSFLVTGSETDVPFSVLEQIHDLTS